VIFVLRAKSWPWRIVVAVAYALAVGVPLASQTDPVVGQWRGALKSAAGVDTPIIITITKKGDVYGGSTNGVNAQSEIPLTKLVVAGSKVTLEAMSESRLGDVSLAGELTAEGAAMKGVGTLAVGATGPSGGRRTTMSTSPNRTE